MIKLNADATVNEDGWIGLGVVARDQMGAVLFSAVRRVCATWAPQIAEAKALAMAARLARRYGVENCILESDCEGLIARLVRGTSFLADLDVVLADILSLCSSCHSINWTHVRREGNFVAHHLAKLFPFGIEQVWENHCPTEISPYVLMDTLSLE